MARVSKYRCISAVILAICFIFSLKTALYESKDDYLINYTSFNLKARHEPLVASSKALDIYLVSDKTTFSAYTLSEDETDKNPCIGAGNNNLCELSNYIRICASRDLPLDTVIYIDGYGECVIKDRMNKRYLGTGRIDILLKTKKEAINFGIKELKYVKTKG